MTASSSQRSVIGIVFDESKQKVLLIQRRDVPSAWVLPGGGVDIDETPADAAIREIHEETGITVAICRQVALYTPINSLTNDTYTFECVMCEGYLTTGNETLDIAFFPINDLPDDFFFLHRDWLADALEQHPFVVRKPISQITYSSVFRYFCRHPVQVCRLLLSRLGCPINTYKNNGIQS